MTKVCIFLALLALLGLALGGCGSPASRAPEGPPAAGKPPSQAEEAAIEKAKAAALDARAQEHRPVILGDIEKPKVATKEPDHAVEGSVKGAAHDTGDQLVTLGAVFTWVGGILLAAGIFARLLLAFAAATNPIVAFITHYGGAGLANLVLESGGVGIITGLLLTWIGLHLWQSITLALVALVVYKWKKVWPWIHAHLHVIEDGANKLIVRAEKK